MKQRNLHNILQVGLQRCLYIEEGRKMGTAITFYSLEPRAVQQRRIYVKYCTAKGCQRNYSFLIIYLYLCLFLSLWSLKKLLGPAHCNFMYLYMLHAQSDTLHHLNIGTRGIRLKVWESSSSPYPRAPRHPAMIWISVGLFVATELGSII